MDINFKPLFDSLKDIKMRGVPTILEMHGAIKAEIDRLSYEELLRHWRFAPAGDPWFKGEIGDYWALRMAAFKDTYPDEAAAISKKVGW